MKRWICVLLLALSSACFAAPAKPVVNHDVSFSLDGQPVASIMRVIYVEAFRERAYFLDPAVLQDQRPISFRYGPKDGDFRTFLATFLRNLGYSMEQRNGADFIKPIPQAERPSIAEDPMQEVFYYRPRYRDGSYLVESLTPLFKGKFTSQRAVSAPAIQAPTSSLGAPSGASVGSGGASSTQQSVAPMGSAQALIERSNDQLIFAGSPKEVAVLKKLLSQIDTDVGQVMVSGVLYEVQTGEHHGSALSLAGSLLSGKLKFNLGTAVAADNFVSLQVADMTAIMQALDSDSRFKVLSNPQVRVASGRSATFVVGDEVPVLGAITYPQGGSSPVQSVDYRSSGVIFTINPDVHDAAIDVRVDQQVSSFVQTTTGVNNSPTLTKRQLSTNVSMADGDVVVIGGLRQNKDTSGGTGLSFLPSWFKAKTSDSSQSEILLFLQLKRL